MGIYHFDEDIWGACEERLEEHLSVAGIR